MKKSSDDKTPLDIYSPYERQRMSIGKLLKKAGVESPTSNFMLMRGLIMKVGKGYIWLATSTGYWRIKLAKAREREPYSEIALLVKIFPSFHGMLLYGYELKEGSYNEMVELWEPFINKAKDISGAHISTAIKRRKIEEKLRRSKKNENAG